MTTISEQLALVIDAKTAGAVTELKKAQKSTEELAVSQARTEASTARLTAANDKLAASAAKVALAEAKQASDSDGITKAQLGLAAAQEKASVSKAQSQLATDKLSAAELQAKAASQGLTQEAGTAGGALDLLGVGGLTAASALTTLGPVAAAAAAALAFKAVADGISNFEKLTGEVRTFQAVAGGTVQKASLLVGEFHQLGIDPDIAAKAVARLGASIGDGTTKLGQYGIQVALTNKGNADVIGTLDNVRAAYQGAADAATRDAIAKQLSRAGAQALIPYLQQTNDQLKALDDATRNSGHIFTPEDLERGLQLKVAANQLKEAFDGIELSLARGVIPELVDSVNLMVKLVDTAKRFKVPILAGVRLIPGVSDVQRATDVIGQLSKKHDLAAFAAEAQKAAEDRLTQQIQGETDAVDKLTSNVVGELDAEKAWRDSAQGLADAQQRVVDTQAALDKLLKDGPVDLKAVAAAEKDLARASEEVTRAQESEQVAQDNLNKAREKASALDLQEAQNKIALAGDRIGQAQAAEQQAREKLDALEGSGTASAGEIAAAQAEVQTRHDEVTQALIDQGKAQQDLITVKQKGTDQDPAVISAERSVHDAHRNVADAVDNRASAEDKLRQAETPDPEFADKVARATNDVAKAHQNVADAQANRVKTALDLSKATDTLTAALSGNAQAVATVLANLQALGAQGLSVADFLGLLGPAPTPLAADAQPNPTAPSPPPNPTDQSGASSPDPLFGGLTPRAIGGPVEPDRDYLVGEHGVEILHMGTRGGYVKPLPDTIAASAVDGQPPAGALASALRAPAAAGRSAADAPATASGHPVIVNVNARSGATAAEIVHEADWALNTLPTLARRHP